MAGPALLLSFDFEDWHQLVHRRLGVHDWDSRGDPLERQTAAALDLLDELQAKATFFLLGMTVRRYPDLVAEIVARGHEPASHGFAHRLVFTQTREEFRRDLEESVEAIASACGRRPVAYRAPAFSINRRTAWAYEELAAAGFRYDSSQYDSPKVPARIGGIPSEPYRLRLEDDAALWELPVAVSTIAGRVVPVGGGSYWRLLPARMLLRGLRAASARSSYPVTYFHPYEVDPQPLHARLPPSPTPKQRLVALQRSVWRNTARRRIPERLRLVAREFSLISYEEAYADIEQRYAQSTRALSREGVLV